MINKTLIIKKVKKIKYKDNLAKRATRQGSKKVGRTAWRAVRNNWPFESIYNNNAFLHKSHLLHCESVAVDYYSFNFQQFASVPNLFEMKKYMAS